jgi:hypothetical protein
LILKTKPVKGHDQVFLKGMIEPSGGFSFKRKKPMPLAAFG